GHAANRTGGLAKSCRHKDQERTCEQKTTAAGLQQGTNQIHHDGRHGRTKCATVSSELWDNLPPPYIAFRRVRTAFACPNQPAGRIESGATHHNPSENFVPGSAGWRESSAGLVRQAGPRNRRGTGHPADYRESPRRISHPTLREEHAESFCCAE